MADDLVFYTNPMSRGRIVRWMLEEIGRPYRTEILDFGTTMKAAPYLAVNPMGKVPALRHGDTVVTEAAAICAYLADAFPEAGLAPPPHDKLRAPYYRWLFFTAGPLEQAATIKSLGVALEPKMESRVGFGTLGNVLAALEQAVAAGDYLVGGKFSAADLYVASHLGWSMMMGAVERRPAFLDYARKLTHRPAALRAKEIDDTLAAAAKK